MVLQVEVVKLTKETLEAPKILTPLVKGNQNHEVVIDNKYIETF